MISPQQALDAVKVLWPNTVQIELIRGSWNAEGKPAVNGLDQFGNRSGVGFIEIEWPDSIHQWPVSVDRWREPKMPQDYGKKARFSDTGDGDDWIDGTLCGFATNSVFPWMSEVGSGWKQCLILAEAQTNPVIYRELESHEIILTGDQYKRSNGSWDDRVSVGLCAGTCAVYRRPIVTYRDGVQAGEGYRLLDERELFRDGDDVSIDHGVTWTAWTEVFHASVQKPKPIYYRRRITTDATT